LGYVRESFYWNNKKYKFDTEEANFKQFGRAEYYGTRYRNTLGDLYTGLVLEAWNSDRITNHNAAEFMGIKNLSHLYDIRETFRKFMKKYAFDTSGISNPLESMPEDIHESIWKISKQIFCHLGLSR